MGEDRLRVESNERVDIGDFRFLAGEGVQASLRQLGTGFLTKGTGDKYVLSGFEISNPAAKQLKVTRGEALLGQRLGGALVYGIVSTQGEPERIIDLNAYAADTYRVYIRFEELEAEQEGRLFWDSTGLGSEYSKTIATRYQANWGLRVEKSSPGAEWLDIGEVVVAGGLTITEERPFFFEGPEGSSYQSGWSTDGGGVATDRNADRASYGIGDLKTFTDAMRQCLEDIKGRGLRRWWERDIGGMNIGFDAAPVEDRVAIGDANFNLRIEVGLPILNWDSTDGMTYDRGSNTLYHFIGGANAYLLSSTRWQPTSSDVSSLGTTTERWQFIYGSVINCDATTFTGLVNANAGNFIGKGTGYGVYGAGGSNNGAGAVFVGGGSNSYGMFATGQGANAGVFGQSDGLGGEFHATSDGDGVQAYGAGTGYGLYSEGDEGWGALIQGGVLSDVGLVGAVAYGGDATGTAKDGGDGANFLGGDSTTTGSPGDGVAGQGGDADTVGIGGTGVVGIGGASTGGAVGSIGGDFTGVGSGAKAIVGTATAGYAGYFVGATGASPAYPALHVEDQQDHPTNLISGDIWLTDAEVSGSYEMYAMLSGEKVQLSSTKAWGTADTDGIGGVSLLGERWNIASVSLVDTNTTMRFFFTDPMNGSGYGAFPTVFVVDTTPGREDRFASIFRKTTTYVDVKVFDLSGGNNVNLGTEITAVSVQVKGAIA